MSCGVVRGLCCQFWLQVGGALFGLPGQVAGGCLPLGVGL